MATDDAYKRMAPEDAARLRFEKEYVMLFHNLQVVAGNLTDESRRYSRETLETLASHIVIIEQQLMTFWHKVSGEVTALHQRVAQLEAEVATCEAREYVIAPPDDPVERRCPAPATIRGDDGYRYCSFHGEKN